MDELIDREKELARLTKEKDSCRKDIEFVSKKLSNEALWPKHPPGHRDERDKACQRPRKN